MLSGKHDVRFVISCDADDETMNTPEMREWIEGQGCEVHYNPAPQTKITAINANVPADGWSLCLLCSDDMLPVKHGYDDRIVELFRQHFPDGDGVLHTNDGRTGKTLNTLPIFDRRYYDRFSYIYCPHGYTSVYVDNEYQEVSERLGRAVYVDETILSHGWVDLTGRDPLHRRNEHSDIYQADHLNFEKRKRWGFPA